jgi:hypothetical protein
VDTAAGNSIILDIGGGRYALYAHLQPGSILVRRGQHVRTGERLALVGNSGNASGPHLHFHLCDAPSALECQGLPYAFRSLVHHPVSLEGDSQETFHVVPTGENTAAAGELAGEDELVELR